MRKSTRARLFRRGDPAIALGEGQFVQQPRQPGVEHRTVVTAGLVADGAGEPALADAGWTDNRRVLVIGDPVAAEQPIKEPAIKAARGAVINVLGHGMMPQPGMSQAKRQTPIVAIRRFMIEQQRQPFGVAEAGGLIVSGQVGKGLGHAGKAELAQQIECGMFQHSHLLQW